MSELTEPRPLKQTIPLDLQRQVEDIQTQVPITIGPPGDLDDDKKRWLIVGICLHSIISPLLRKYVDPIVSNLYNALVSSHSIDTQGYHNYLKTFPGSPYPYYLNYESINNNRKLIKQYRNYDYKVTSHVDLSKLFLLPNMAQYSGINETCDSSALFGMVINISIFPPGVQTFADKIRSDIRNPWAHCDFRDWSTGKYTNSFNLMGQLVQSLGLTSNEESKIVGELNTWETNGKNFLSGTRLGLEIVGEIRQHTHVLSSYVQTVCTETDSQFIRVQEELKRIENDLRERIKILESKTKEQDETLNNLNEEIKKQIKDHIPQHIRAQHEQEIREWEQDQITFLETRATHHILDSLQFDNCIVVTGSSGCGKSSNIHHAALRLRERFGYEIIPVLTGPTNLINYYNENKRQVFVVDDICGKETLNTQMLQMWRDYSEQIEKLLKISEKDVVHTNIETISKVSNAKLLISCRLHVYKESQFQRIALLTKKECNLLSKEMRLLPQERLLMLHKYLTDDIIANITQDMMTDEFFPLVCRLSKGKPSGEVRRLFTAPLLSIKESLKNIFIEYKEQCCALVVCILFENGFNTDWLKSKIAPEMKEKLKDIVEEFDIHLNKETSRNSLVNQLNILTGTYLKQRNTEYRMIHDKIYKMTAVIFGQHLPETFIRYATSICIRDHFIFESLIEAKKCENDDLIVLSKYKEEDYFQRLVRDLDNNVITSTFHNNQLIYKSFIHKLVSFFETDYNAQQVLKKLDIEGCEMTKDAHKSMNLFDTQFNTTPLIESASSGYFAIVQFLIVVIGCDVNNKKRIRPIETRQQYTPGYFFKLNDYKASPLEAACYRGHTDIVKLLLENHADVSQCNAFKESPLFVACKRGYKNIVKILLKYNADVSQRDINGQSPFLLACMEKNTDILKMLLQKKADVSLCDYDEKSPIFWACSLGNIGIVKLLIENNADVSKCSKHGWSPLYVACRKGYTNIVDFLLLNKACVSRCNNIGQSLLFPACEEKHPSMIELRIHNANTSRGTEHADLKETLLCVACKKGYKAIVIILLKHNFDVSQCNSSGQSPLLLACKEQHTEIVKLLLQFNADVSCCDMQGLWPLFCACELGNINIVQLLLQYNDDVSRCATRYGSSPLDVACKKGHTDIVRLLLQNKTYGFWCNSLGKTQLYIACEEGHKETVQLLLQNNADVSHCSNSDGTSPLYVACKGGHTGIVKLLLHKNADVSQCDRTDGTSPLYMACKGGHTDIVTLLLHNKADISQCDNDGQSPLLVACKGRNIDIVGLLLLNKADIYQCDNKGESPLYVACKGGHTEIVKLLLQNNGNARYITPAGQSLLFVACKRGYTDLAKILLQANADISHITSEGESSLYVACAVGDTEIVKLLMQYNADVTQSNSWGQLPLIVACTGGYTDIVKLLLQNNADKSMCNRFGEFPLYVACEKGHTDTVKLLLQNNAVVSQCNNDGQSALHAACKHNYIDIVKLLLQYKAGLSLCDSMSQSPLLVACISGHTDLVKCLLQNRADMSLCDNKGQSPLLVSCLAGRIQIVKLLIQNNADVSQCNKLKESPLYVACRRGNTATVKLLLQNNANVAQSEAHEGKSPLHVACDIDSFKMLKVSPSLYRKRCSRHIETVKLLLAWNADARMCDNKGQTPLHIARKSKFKEIVNLLEENLQ